MKKQLFILFLFFGVASIAQENPYLVKYYFSASDTFNYPLSPAKLREEVIKGAKANKISFYDPSTGEKMTLNELQFRLGSLIPDGVTDAKLLDNFPLFDKFMLEAEITSTTSEVKYLTLLTEFPTKYDKNFSGAMVRLKLTETKLWFDKVKWYNVQNNADTSTYFAVLKNKRIQPQTISVITPAGVEVFNPKNKLNKINGKEPAAIADAVKWYNTKKYAETPVTIKSKYLELYNLVNIDAADVYNMPYFIETMDSRSFIMNEVLKNGLKAYSFSFPEGSAGPEWKLMTVDEVKKNLTISGTDMYPANSLGLYIAEKVKVDDKAGKTEALQYVGLYLPASAKPNVKGIDQTIFWCKKEDLKTALLKKGAPKYYHPFNHSDSLTIVEALEKGKYRVSGMQVYDRTGRTVMSVMPSSDNMAWTDNPHKFNAINASFVESPQIKDNRYKMILRAYKEHLDVMDDSIPVVKAWYPDKTKKVYHEYQTETFIDLTHPGNSDLVKKKSEFTKAVRDLVLKGEMIAYNGDNVKLTPEKAEASLKSTGDCTYDLADAGILEVKGLILVEQVKFLDKTKTAKQQMIYLVFNCAGGEKIVWKVPFSELKKVSESNKTIGMAYNMITTGKYIGQVRTIKDHYGMKYTVGSDSYKSDKILVGYFPGQ